MRRLDTSEWIRDTNMLGDIIVNALIGITSSAGINIASSAVWDAVNALTKRAKEPTPLMRAVVTTADAFSDLP
jgi:hypothetical protein